MFNWLKRLRTNAITRYLWTWLVSHRSAEPRTRKPKSTISLLPSTRQLGGIAWPRH